MTVLMPTTTREALEMLADGGGDLVPMAGGTDLLVNWPRRPEEPHRVYVDLSGIRDLERHRWTQDELVLGPLTTYWDVLGDERARAALPLLAQAARQVGSIQIQARGTWAGNVVNASPAADGVPVLMAYDAVVTLASTAAVEDVPLADFYLGYRRTRRQSDQLVTAIRIPLRDYSVQLFEKVGPRAAQAITKVGLAVTRSTLGWRVVANSVAPTVRRCPTVEQMLADEVPVASPDGFLPALSADIAPIDDVRSTAAYRTAVLCRLLFYDLREMCDHVG